MNRFAALILVSAAMALTAIAEPPVRKHYTVNYSRPLPSDIVEKVKSLDPKRERDRVLPSKGELGTPFGLRFEASCASSLSSEPEKRERQLAALNGVIAEAFNRILICRDNYPELDPWFKSWIAMARRHHISCVKETSQQRKAGAWNYLGEHTVYPIDTFEKSSNGSGGATFKDGLETISLDTWTLDALIHEIFHATQANNRIDHNEIERIPTKHRTNRKTKLDVVECNDDIAMDRVNIVASLCSDEKLSNSGQKALYEIADRMANCPESKSCVGLFSRDVGDNIDNLREYIWDKFQPHPSGKLNINQSRLLCARIRDRAECERDVANYDEWHGDSPEKQKGRIDFAVKISKKPEVKALQKRLRDRLEKITPNFKNALPGEWIKLDSSVKAEFDDLKNDACFKAMFLLAPSGNYFVGGPPKKEDAFNGMEYFSRGNTLAGHIDFYLMPRLLATGKVERSCQASDTPNRIKVALSLIYERLNSGEVAFNSEGYYKIANNSFDEHVHRIGAGMFYPELGPVMTQLIGKELIESTDQVLMRFHPYSRAFDCVGAGYSLHTAAEMVRQGFQEAATSAKKSCP